MGSTDRVDYRASVDYRIERFDALDAIRQVHNLQYVWWDTGIACSQCRRMPTIR